MKQAPKAAQSAPAAKPFTLSPIAMLVLRAGLILVGIGCVIYGVRGGGLEAVIAKAVAICTECIGLG